MKNLMNTNIAELGLPDKKLAQLEKKGVQNIKDALRLLPRELRDYRQVTRVKDAKDGDYCAICAKVHNITTSGKAVFVSIVDDRDGKKNKENWMKIVFFNKPYVKSDFFADEYYTFFGKIVESDYGKQMVNPEDYQFGESGLRIKPTYPSVQGMSENYLAGVIKKIFNEGLIEEYLEPEVVKEYGLMGFKEAYEQIHFCSDMETYNVSLDRLLFDDLFYFSLNLEEQRIGVKRTSEFVMKEAEMVKPFMKSLPFKLTNDQLTTIRSLFIAMRKGDHVNALVQGDVGCGKTVVAIILMLIAFENGYQSALMAPTNVLAKQHYEDLVEKLAPLGVNVVYLSGDMKVRARRAALKMIADGEAHVIVGTHAVISKDVEFRSLALTIVDEEHRFGVLQREELKKKSKEGVHMITMSATPIPRTLALTLYGDALDIHTIKTLPKGRSPIKTAHMKSDESAYRFIDEEIRKGRQAYIVCPLIEESSADVMEGVKSVEETYQRTVKYFKANNPSVKVAMISGRMKQADVNKIIEEFSNGNFDIVISTTIIEVGVNVPNASVIMINNAERFGLSGLHQLRGRVGRGNHQGYCILVSEKYNNPKLEAMVETTDGFIIAQKDLEIRGTGDFIGVQQSGENKYVTLMLKNQELYERIRKTVLEILNDEERKKRYFA